MVAANIMDGFIRHILREGVTSKTDLLHRLEEDLRADIEADPLSIPMEELNEWLLYLGLASIFKERRLITLPDHAPSRAPEPSKQVGQHPDVPGQLPLFPPDQDDEEFKFDSERPERARPPAPAPAARGAGYGEPPTVVIPPFGMPLGQA